MPVTALYDCRSKQDYIYRTNRITEISGGSDLLTDVYSDFLNEVAESKYGIRILNDWEKLKPFNKDDFIKQGYDGTVIYIGGGNLYIIYRDRETFIKANKVMSRMLLDKTATISVIASCVETTDDFSADRRNLYIENTKQKNTDSVMLPCNVLPFTQVDRLTYQPIVKKESNKTFSRESRLKNRKFREREDSNSDAKFLDKLVTSKGTESVLAVIYIDGNAMGNKIKALTEGLHDYTTCVQRLREFSLKVDKSFVDDTLKSIKKKLVEKEKTDEKYVGKFRRVIGGGDEITLICNARAVPDILDAYFDSLCKAKLIGDEPCSACAGVALFHSHAPFADVYKIAEQCCESGKNATRPSGSKENYIDFHYCHAGITNDLKTIRKTQENGITARPYELNNGYKAFMELGEKLANIGRSNIKALSNAILKDESYYAFEVSRINSLKKTEKIDSNDENLKKMIFDISIVYDLWFAKYENNKGKEQT